MLTAINMTYATTVLCQSHPHCRARIAAASEAESAAASSATDACTSQPASAAAPAAAASDAPFVLILLNQPLDSFFEALWTNAAFRICADGSETEGHAQR